MSGDSLEWNSSIDGSLGTGDQLSIADLSLGSHTITFSADDGSGSIVTDTVQIDVVSDPTQISPLPNKLIINESSILFNPKNGITTAQIIVDNQNWFNQITWNATSSKPWIRFDAVTGITPHELMISLDEAKMPVGVHSAEITLSSPSSPGDTVVIEVTLINIAYLYLPMIATDNTPSPIGEPDLVGWFYLEPNKFSFEAGEAVVITAEITNQGTSVAEDFWVDFYINPSPPPNSANIVWNGVCGMSPCFGIVWFVPELAPGETITLTSTDNSYSVSHTIWPGWFALGTSDLYLYVDSYGLSSPNGAVIESNETNNRFELRGISVTGKNPAQINNYQIDSMTERLLPVDD